MFSLNGIILSAECIRRSFIRKIFVDAKITTQRDFVTKRHTNPNDIARCCCWSGAEGIKTMNNAPTTTLGLLLMPAGVPATKAASR
jgi:hypothetical protein